MISFTYPNNYNEVWKRKSVLVTGAGGFLGRHLFNKLTSLGANVVGLSFSSKEASYLCGDIRVKEFVRRVFKEYRPHVVYHLAGISTVEKATTNIFDAFSTNIQGLSNVIEMASLYGTRRFIYASTIHFANQASDLTPNDYYSRPYEASKYYSESIVRSYMGKGGIILMMPRFTNVYGPGDLHFTRIIPTIIRQAFLNKKINLWGDGSTSRDYLYIDDALAGIQKMMAFPITQKTNPDIFNFSSGKSTSVYDLAQLIIKCIGNNAPVVFNGKSIRREPQKLSISYQKAMHELNWKPNTSLNEGLIQTINWYRSYFQ